MVGIKINLGSCEAAIFCEGLSAEESGYPQGRRRKQQMLRKAEREWGQGTVESWDLSSCEACILCDLPVSM